MTLTELSQSPARAPEYNLVREGVVVADNVTLLGPSHGITANDFEYLHVQIAAQAGDNVAIDVFFWSPGLAQWVKGDIATIAAAGLGVSREFTIPVRGRRAFIALSGTFAGGPGIKMYASGF